MSCAAVLWTGGKDCALAMRRSILSGKRVAHLVTFGPRRKEFLAHPLEVLSQQAAAIGLPHHVITIDEPYDQSYRRAIEHLRDSLGIVELVTGDIDLVDGLPNWISQCCQGLGVKAQMPLWRRPREALLDELMSEGFETIFSCVKQPWFDESWAGRELTREAVNQMREISARTGLDICGENGEYHSLVLAGPLWQGRIDIGPARVVHADGMWRLEGISPAIRGAAI